MTSTPVFRPAVEADLEAIVAMLADDILGQQRENTSLPLAQSYLEAFAAIEADPNQYLAVVELNGAVVGTLQITYMPGAGKSNPSVSPARPVARDWGV